MGGKEGGGRGREWRREGGGRGREGGSRREKRKEMGRRHSRHNMHSYYIQAVMKFLAVTLNKANRVLGNDSIWIGRRVPG